MPRLLAYTLKRLAFVPIGAFVIASLSWFLINLVPSDPARTILGDLATPEEVARLRHELGLDRGLFTRYLDYINDLILHQDLGRSYYSNRPVVDDLLLYVPNTLELVIPAFLLAAIVGVTIGAIGARFSRHSPDHIARSYIILAQAIPDFLIALLLIYFLFYKLHWAPAPTGRLGILDVPPPVKTHGLMTDSVLSGQWSTFRSAVAHSILPVVTLAVAVSAFLAKTSRSSISRAFNSQQVDFARACGLPERQVWLYAFRAARTPIITYGVVVFAALLGGAAIVETIFAWDGLGQFAVGRMQQVDLPEMQGIILILGLKTLIVLIFLDVLVALLDPRVSYDAN